jgi:hypothetical protein
MGAVLVVVDHPPVRDFTDIRQGVEQIQAEHFLPERSVKSFDVRVLVRFSRLNIANDHPRRLSPFDKIAAEKLRTIIGPQDIREAPFGAQPLKYSNQPSAGYGGIDLHGQAFTVEIIDDIKRAEPLAGIEGITHEVGRPDLIWTLWHPQGLFYSFGQPFLCTALLIQMQLAIDPINPFMVPWMAITAQGVVTFPESPAAMPFNQGIQCRDNSGVALRGICYWFVESRPREAETLAAAFDR